jgi:hypothetical protein
MATAMAMTDCEIMRMGATPRRRATDDTVSPGWKLSSMICSF